MLLSGGVMVLSGLFLTSLEYHLIATILFFIGILTVTAVLGKRFCPFCILLNVTHRIFDKHSAEQNLCSIRFDSPVSDNSDSSE